MSLYKIWLVYCKIKTPTKWSTNLSLILDHLKSSPTLAVTAGRFDQHTLVMRLDSVGLGKRSFPRGVTISRLVRTGRWPPLDCESLKSYRVSIDVKKGYSNLLVLSRALSCFRKCFLVVWHNVPRCAKA